MFSSNGFLLSKAIDSDVSKMDSSDFISSEKNTSTNYKQFRRAISILNLNDEETFAVSFDEPVENRRMQTIKAILNTESTYLKRIKEVLTVMLTVLEQKFDRLGKRAIMYQISNLLENFPTIFDLHYAFHKKMKEELKSSKEIGNVLLEFLSQTKLLEVYTNYIDKFSNTLDICKMMKEKKYHVRYPELSQFEAILMSPVQRFPQLSMAIADIYKNTLDGHKEKATLFRAVSISKSITARLDRQRREFEYNNFADIESSLTKLKLDFSSTQLLTNNSVFLIRSNFQIPRKRLKIPYYLILCDSNVVMVPRDVPLAELTDKTAFCYSLEEIYFKQKILSNFKNRTNSYSELEEVKDLYRLANDSFSNDAIIKEYEELLKDYKVLLEINEHMQLLTFRYKGIDTLKLSKSLVELEQRLKAKEVELNLQLGSILTLTIKVANSLEDKKVFLFDSIRQSNEWKMNFKRAKLLKNIEMTISWNYYSFGKRISEIKPKELPLLFQPFLFKDNGILNVNSRIVKCQSVALVVGLNVYRCLWICLENGWVVILHFDYNKWNVLESFKIEKPQLVTSLCVSSSSSVGSSDHLYDTEIWIACGDTILIYSLLENQRSIIKQRLNLPSDIKALCNVENKLFVALKSKKVFVYSKCKAPFWLQESEFSFKRFLASYNEELNDIYYGHGLVYILFKTKVIVCKSNENMYCPLKVYESAKEITTIWITSEGVWLSLNSSNQLIFYDKCLENTYQIISLPVILYQKYDVGCVTSIYMNEKYIWLGTKNGFIICISTIDSMYCRDYNIPMYFSSKCSIGPIVQLMPFQNIHGVSVKCPPEEFASIKDMFDQRAPPFRRSMSIDPLDDGFFRQSFSCQNISVLSNDSKDDLSSSTNSSLHSAIENLKNTTPILILAFGTGISTYTDDKKEKEFIPLCEVEEEHESVMFTFLE